jgi:hypothetical protein
VAPGECHNSTNVDRVTAGAWTWSGSARPPGRSAEGRTRVTELPPGGLEIAAEVGQIAFGPGDVEQSAEALLEPLRRAVPFQGAWIALLDQERDSFVSLVTHGYDDPCHSYLNSSTVFEEAELLGLNRAARPMCLRDLPIPPAETRGWAEYMSPAGFREASRWACSPRTDARSGC